MDEHLTTMTNVDVARRIQAFLSRSFGGRQFGDQEDIFALGFGNSLFAMQLVTFIEREFGVEIGGEDLRLDNFRNVAAMSGMVCRHLTRPAEDDVPGAPVRLNDRQARPQI
jgi:methoxymalonate biosynthesis acyl carrier protein